MGEKCLIGKKQNNTSINVNYWI